MGFQGVVPVRNWMVQITHYPGRDIDPDLSPVTCNLPEEMASHLGFCRRMPVAQFSRGLPTTILPSLYSKCDTALYSLRV